MSLWWVFGFFFLERMLELGIARRNRQRILARGGREFHPESYRNLVLMHLAFFAALILESYPWRVALDALTWSCLAALVLLQGLRYWCVVSLGDFWNTRIIVLPDASVRRTGPYRWVRHPNYIAVTLEIFFLPLLMRAPFTLLIFSLTNLALLRQRIQYEEEALRQNTDFAERFDGPGRPDPEA